MFLRVGLVDELQERVDATVNDGGLLRGSCAARVHELIQLGGLVLAHARRAGLALLLEGSLHSHHDLADLVLLVVRADGSERHHRDPLTLQVAVTVSVRELRRVVTGVTQGIVLQIDGAPVEAIASHELLRVPQAQRPQLHRDALGEVRHLGDTGEAVGLVGGEQLREHVTEGRECGVGFVGHGFLSRAHQPLRS